MCSHRFDRGDECGMSSDDWRTGVCHCVRTHVRNGRPDHWCAGGIDECASPVGQCRREARERVAARDALVRWSVSHGRWGASQLRRRPSRWAVADGRRAMTGERSVPAGGSVPVHDEDNCFTHARVAGEVQSVRSCPCRRPLRPGVAQCSAHDATAKLSPFNATRSCACTVVGRQRLRRARGPINLDRERPALGRGAASGTPDAHGAAVRPPVGRRAGPSLDRTAERRPTAARPHGEGRAVWNG